MLELPVVPGKSCGFLRIGMPLRRLLDELESRSETIPLVQFKYNDIELFSEDIIIHLPANGIIIYVDPVCQRLSSIQIYNISRCVLTYSGKEFTSEKIAPTLVQVYKTFGPTYAGVLNEEKKEYYLNYPGIQLTFPIPEKYLDMFSTKDIPLEFPDGTTAELQSLKVWMPAGMAVNRKGVALEGEGVKNEGVSPTVVSNTDYYFEDVTVELGKSVTFNERQFSAYFHITTPQDLLHALGPPPSIHYKTDDKMSIHLPVSLSPTSPTCQTQPTILDQANKTSGSNKLEKLPHCNDYLFNYFDLGIDFLFSGTTHTLKKAILHCNVPGSYDFHRYSRCNFLIQIDRDTFITSSTPFSVIKSLSNEPLGPPVVFSRDLTLTPEPSELESGNLPLNSGTSLYWGYESMILEVTKRGVISSLTLF